MSRPAVIAFYSYATGVSIELPVGFEFNGEDEVCATYVDRADDGPVTAATPVVRIRVVGEIEDGGGRDVVRDLADGFAAADHQTLSRRDREIDECHAVTVVSEQAGRVLHQTAVDADGRLLSIIAAAPSQDLLPSFDAAIDSIRFIAL
ncbi:MAG: hypothetical protein ABI232_09420 [Jatrophihabitantaceae bacterium]